MNTFNYFLTISTIAGGLLFCGSVNSYAQSNQNEALITQISFENRAEIDQGARMSDDLAKENLADVFQDGSQHEATIRQASLGRSTALNNTAVAEQRGEGHFIKIDQGVNEGFSRNNAAIVDQQNEFHTVVIELANDGIASDNVAFIKQVDDTHTAVIKQGVEGGEAERNQATIDQDGTTHAASIAQGSGFGEAKENSAEIIQYGGLGNEAIVLQGAGIGGIDGGDATMSIAQVLQNGSGHYVLTIQNNSVNDRTEISQQGTGHYARVAQGVALP